MTHHYFDPSAWIKRHFQEPGSETVSALFRAAEAGGAAACCRLGLIEMVATIARKAHGEALDTTTVNTLLENVRADFAAFLVVPIDEPRIAHATDLALRYRLRTMDAIHLACAISLQPAGETVMVSADMELLAAAEQAGLTTMNPTTPAASAPPG